MELYLDNFRGFEKQYIPLNDINFLVGENSTGKTTLLGLLSLYSELGQAWHVDFKNEFVDFGSFSDIISKGKRAKKKITVGFNNNDNDIFPKGQILLTYEDQNGFPSLKEISLRYNNIIVKLYSNEKENIAEFYKTTPPNNHQWAETHSDASNNFLFKKEVKVPFDFELEPSYISEISPDNKEQKKILSEFEYYSFYKFPSEDFIFWIDPVRSKPRRIYEPQKMKYSAEGEHTPTLLRNILLNNTAKQNKLFIAELERFGISSGLFDSIKIDQYRKSKDSPFSLLFKLKGKELKISNVGYGISQVLPILTEVLYAPKGSTFLIQQPEVHLHPRSQAYFGEFVYNQLITQKKKFVIETHSDYLIDRFRLQVRRHNGNIHKKVNVLFFETDGQKNKVTRIDIDKNGDYESDQPQKFREFFLKEEMDLLGL
jgi:predicted ATPase